MLLLLLLWMERTAAQLVGQTTPPPFNPTLRHSYLTAEPPLDIVQKRAEQVKYDFKYEWPLMKHYLGHLYAGAAEFSWIVRVRADYSNLDSRSYFSVGQLISSQHVMTTCRAVSELICRQENKRLTVCKTMTPDCPCVDVRSNAYILMRPPDTIFVHYYATNPSSERLDSRVPEHSAKNCSFKYQSVAPVKAVIGHQNCQWNAQLWGDLALVILNSRLTEFPSPWVGLISPPVLSGRLFHDQRLKFIEKRKIICYVASFGGNMSSIKDKDNTVKDFKVKYRVYPSDFYNCFEQYAAFCPFDICILGFDMFYRQQFWHIECWETRNKIGAVCDHDRGAPIVCNGKVEGVVLRAAFPWNCNVGIPLVFFVQRLVYVLPQFLQTLRFTKTESTAEELNIVYSWGDIPIPFPTLHSQKVEYPDNWRHSGQIVKAHSGVSILSASIVPLLIEIFFTFLTKQKN
ncbi:hypothetical protein GE061_018280 [Apolygus lucorum]|uniref:Peptidase S1 domain-containing protein n=1 Tax=Apolygus lucorum TaxID=248454 RepID=A0A8S9XDF0_APOLU|nr:hypothetical protein GE061_018280 [Apolygus lucorum]